MKTKHTFIVTFAAGLMWTAFLFADQSGPRPASNGILGVTCAQAGCHVGNPVNSATGSVTLSGLPVEWSPGQTYLLTVTVQRPGAVKYGFQLSAVSDADNLQAGSFSNASGENRVTIICGTNFQNIPCGETGAVQYAEHNTNAGFAPPFSGIFRVNWTAPATATPGTVRFNLAGAAADGDALATGDFIYTGVELVAAAGPANSSSPFSLTNLQGSATSTNGAGNLPTVGYARIQALPSSTTPSGVAIFGLRQNNFFVSEAGVPASPLLTAGRIYVEVSGVQRAPGAVNTGIAIANPNNQPATVNFFFTDAVGTDSFRNPITIPANGQRASFVDEEPFSSGPNIRGTLSFTSDVPVAVIALRGYYNERPSGSEFLITTLPVLDTSIPAPSTSVTVPHFAYGGGWTTQIVLVNPTDNVLTGTVQFFNNGTPGTPAPPVIVIANNQSSSSFDYVIPAKGSFKLATSNVGGATITGSVRITPTGQAGSPSAISIFSFKSGNIVVSEAGVLGVPGNAFRMYAEGSGTGQDPGTIQTGIAVANPGATAATVIFELFRLDGTPAGVANAVRTLGPGGQTAGFLSDLFPALPLPFKGILRISTSAPSGVSLVGLRSRYNERRDFLITTTPASDEGSPATNALKVFPHLVNGGGYTTQFILFSGTGGQASSGSLRFYAQDGTLLSLTVN